MNREARKVQIGISIASGVGIFIHLIWPNIAIDGTTLTLFAFALLPWLAPLFRALELPGGLKVEFKDLLQRQKQAAEAGLLARPHEGDDEETGGAEYTFLSIAADDPNLALAGLRIEIERRLTNIALERGLDIERTGARRTLTRLHKAGVFTDHEESVLADLIGTLNMAVHGAEVSDVAADWAIDVGPRILEGLESRLATFKRLSGGGSEEED